MKYLYRLPLLLLAAVAFVACNDNNEPEIPPEVPENTDLVLVDRNTGILYKVDKANGDTTAVDTIMTGAEVLPDMRSMFYSPTEQLLYVGLTANGNGNIYSVDPATFQATLLVNNNGNDWDGVGDIIQTRDDSLMFTTFYNDGNEEFNGTPDAQLISGEVPSLIKVSFNGNLGSITSMINNSDSTEMSLYGGLGLTYSADDNEVYVGMVDNVIVPMNITSGEFTEYVNLPFPSGASFGPGDESTYPRNFVLDTDGTYYGLVLEAGEGSTTYLVSFDPVTETLTTIRSYSGNAFVALAVVTEGVL